MKHDIKRLSALLLAAAMILPLAACGPQDPETIQARFDDFVNELFVGAIESDYTSTLFFVEEPEQYGIDRDAVEVSIGTPETDENYKAAREQNQALLDEIHRYDRELLTPEQQDTYDIIEASSQLGLEMGADRFRYHGSYFSTFSGVHTNLLTNLSELQITEEADAAKLPQLLESVTPYIDSLLDYTRKQQEHGTLTIDFDEVIEVCDGVVEQGENGTVLASLYAQVDALDIDPDAKARYREEIRTAYNEHFLTSYQKIADTMEELRGGFNNEEGMCAIPDGKEYSELLFAAATGVEESPEEVRQLAEERLQKAFSRLGGLAFLYPDEYNAWLEGAYTTSFTSYEQMLEFLADATAADFPDAGELNYVIDPIPEDVANSGVAAYFIVPAVDEKDAMRIRVNTGNTVELDALSTFTTLAHEGIPGHMYASAYSYGHLSSDFRKVLGTSGGFNEGYATYVELLSLDYLESTGIPASVLDMERLNVEMTNCLVTIMDIAINYEGMSREQFREEFSSVFDPAFLDEYYDLMRLEPTAYLAYYVGWMKLEELRADAEKQLGDAFTDLDFHTALLQSGSVPYSIVERNVEHYIQRTLEALSGTPAGEGEAGSQSAAA